MNNIELITYKLDELKTSVIELEKMVGEMNKNYFILKNELNEKINTNKEELKKELEITKQELRNFVLRIFALFGTLIGVIIFILKSVKNF